MSGQVNKSCSACLLSSVNIAVGQRIGHGKMSWYVSGMTLQKTAPAVVHATFWVHLSLLSICKHCHFPSKSALAVSGHSSSATWLSLLLHSLQLALPCSHVECEC